jgi:O-antigen chain-terminating methyltransferase
MADEPAIDVARLVDDLRERVERVRRDGAYGDDPAAIALRAPAPEARVRFRPELAYSTKPLVGRPLSRAKALLMRLLIHPMDDLARQADAAISTDRAWAREAVAGEAGARERVAEDLQDLMARIGAIEETLARLQLGPRLARLERRPVAPAAASAPVAAGATAAAASDAGGIDYLAFEARFRGSEETVAARQQEYLRHLEGRRRVVDLGCGRGELLELLRDAGVPAYGVDTEPDFVALGAEKGLDVRAEDVLAHLEGLAEGAVDAIVASHVVEHLPPPVLARLVAAAAERLPEGGVLIMETPNPESLVAGSINFHRDPTHLRPVHPDTLRFMCESAGFAAAEIVRLSPVPDAERLPLPAPGDEPLARHVDRLAERLNAVVYGFQDYAVIARR